MIVTILSFFLISYLLCFNFPGTTYSIVLHEGFHDSTRLQESLDFGKTKIFIDLFRSLIACFPAIFILTFKEYSFNVALKGQGT